MDIKNLKKYKLFVNLKKYYFYKKNIYFLRYIILIYSIKLKDKKKKIVKNQYKSKLVINI